VKDSVLIKFAFVAASLLATVFGQNPVPQIVGPVKPMAVAPGSGPFVLSVYGANFVPSAIVNWNGQPRKTNFISGHELQAHILAADVAKNTAGLISVTNPPPGGGNSSAGWAQVEVHQPVTTIAFKKFHPYQFGGYLLLPADFNHDGILDLVGQYGALIEVNPGRGDGTFHFGSIAGHYYDSLGAAYGDFNGDGNLDLVFPQMLLNNSNVWGSVALGDGRGEFTAGSRIGFVRADRIDAIFALVGDFNRDGKLDLILSDEQGFSVFLGNGDGSFSHSIDVANSTAETTGIVAGDFNGDGILDIALQSSNFNTGTFLYIFLGNGDGTFQPQRTIVASSASPAGGSLQLSDFNGDGIADLAFRADSQVCVLLGNGDGTFQTQSCSTVGKQLDFNFATADINADGKPDLIVSNYGNFNKPELDIYLGKGDGTFASPQEIPGDAFGELGVVTGDFNSDGLLDVLFQTGLGMCELIQAP
jgi:FG-GAP-like repeat